MSSKPNEQGEDSQFRCFMKRNDQAKKLCLVEIEKISTKRNADIASVINSSKYSDIIKRKNARKTSSVKTFASYFKLLHSKNVSQYHYLNHEEPSILGKRSSSLIEAREYELYKKHKFMTNVALKNCLDVNFEEEVGIEGQTYADVSELIRSYGKNKFQLKSKKELHQNNIDHFINKNHTNHLGLYKNSQSVYNILNKSTRIQNKGKNDIQGETVGVHKASSLIDISIRNETPEKKRNKSRKNINYSASEKYLQLNKSNISNNIPLNSLLSTPIKQHKDVRVLPEINVISMKYSGGDKTNTPSYKRKIFLNKLNPITSKQIQLRETVEPFKAKRHSLQKNNYIEKEHIYRIKNKGSTVNNDKKVKTLEINKILNLCKKLERKKQFLKKSFRIIGHTLNNT